MEPHLLSLVVVRGLSVALTIAGQSAQILSIDRIVASFYLKRFSATAIQTVIFFGNSNHRFLLIVSPIL